MDNKIYALVESGGTVVNTIVWDGSAPYQPDEGHLAVLVPDGSGASIGWTYDGTSFIAPPIPPAPPLTSDQILVANTAKRTQLLMAATLAMGPLQHAVELGDPEEAETAMLTAWKQFSVAVSRVDLTQANPTWPGAPQEGYGAAMLP